MSQAINNLSQGTPTTASQFPFYDPSQGQDRRCSLQDMLALVGASADGKVTLFSSPNANSFTINVSTPAAGQSAWLLITPTGVYSPLTINLPVGSSDGQELLVNCTQAVAALTVTGATVGASAQPVNGAPASLTANGFFRLRYSVVNGSWYRVG